MEVRDDRLFLTTDEIRHTGFPGELEISHGTLMSVHCSIADNARAVGAMQAMEDELSHTTMGIINEEARRQACRWSVAREIANQLSIRETLAQIAGLPTVPEPPTIQ